MFCAWDRTFAYLNTVGFSSKATISPFVKLRVGVICGTFQNKYTEEGWKRAREREGSGGEGEGIPLVIPYQHPVQCHQELLSLIRARSIRIGKQPVPK
jgi:hypothetical protein